jgi:hypothetical protein
MPASRVLQFLSIPAALGLGTALVLACSDGGPTAPADQLSPVQTATPFTAPKKGGTGGKDTVVDDVDLTCKNNYVLRPETSFTAVYDLNGNDQVCEYSHDGGGGGPKKH